MKLSHLLMRKNMQTQLVKIRPINKSRQKIKSYLNHSLIFSLKPGYNMEFQMKSENLIKLIKSFKATLRLKLQLLQEMRIL